MAAALDTANDDLASLPVLDKSTTLQSSDIISNKRKRESQNDHAATINSSRLQQQQRDIFDLLSKNDSTPSLLAFDLDSDATNEPSAKKARLSGSGQKSSTIGARLSNAEYTSLQALAEDATKASQAMGMSIRTKSLENDAHLGRVSVEDLKSVQRIDAFAHFIKMIVAGEERDGTQSTTADVQKDSDGSGTAVGHLAKGKSGTVLTLFGNAPTPKQLFSSMQHPRPTNMHPLIKSELPVEEMSLPNGLAASKIIAAPVEDDQKGPTFEDSFAPPFNLPALLPPKAHKRSVTRDISITWEFKDPITQRNKKGGYTVQPQTVGDWLGYGGIDQGHDISSREKRKQRDRALSSGESAQPAATNLSCEEMLVKEEEALFRRAYSSFAPSCDNTKSLVPDDTKSMLWWQRVGDKRFNETFAIDPALQGDGPNLSEVDLQTTQDIKATDDDFEDVIKAIDSLEDEQPQSRSKTDVDQVLSQIYDLLDNLSSHQRIRNASLPSSVSASRAPISPAPLLAARVGRPDSPAEDEISTYESLQRELAYLVLKLPPYALAKLDGDQLSELGVSRLITFECKNVKGTMEEDQVARLAKYNALATATSTSNLSRSTSSSTPHYNTTAQRTPAIGQAANTRYGQTAQYSTTRTPAPQFPRSTSTQYGTPGGTPSRPGYQQQGPFRGFYANTQNGQHLAQQARPLPGTFYSGLTQAPFPRTQTNAPNATSYQNNATAQGTPFNRTASPAKSEYAQQPTQRPFSAQHGQQPGSERGTPNYPTQSQTPVNGNPAGSAPTQTRPASTTPQPSTESQRQMPPNGQA
ncbi:Hypothetical protein R9X50_00723600 [Acrodontium crateriforme]|uniref:Uncharacterized protein n=1 Tax=Acrodontium crateriforme TaxID=150365 RepID=A0AAQ3MCQ5_9PEZI|nr:Hypothetical protein R9X50_00723600 [Acrodontium crateriforme]